MQRIFIRFESLCNIDTEIDQFEEMILDSIILRTEEIWAKKEHLVSLFKFNY